MPRLLIPVMIVCIVCCSLTGLTGCSGTESGTKQISEKAAPDPELNPQVKTGKQKTRR